MKLSIASSPIHFTQGEYRELQGEQSPTNHTPDSSDHVSTCNCYN